MFRTASRKKQVAGLLLFAVILALSFSCNRLTNLGVVGDDLDASHQPAAFTDVTVAAGIDFTHRTYESDDDKIGATVADAAFGAGVVVLDFNDDSLDDVLVVNGDGPNALYRNNGDGTFTDVAQAAGLDDPLVPGHGGCAADYDNDGDRDLYLTNYGPDRLFRNDGSGTFADDAERAGLPHSAENPRSMGCAWGDYDSDGLVDLLVVRYHYRPLPAEPVFSPLLDERAAPRAGRLGLYHNNGDGTFSSVTGWLNRGSDPPAGDQDLVANLEGAGFQPGWVDFDNDGDLDLYVVNDHGTLIHPNVLWRNDGPLPSGDWGFTDISARSGSDAAMDGMGLAVGDYNLDGFLDLYMTNIGDGVLLRNNGDGLSFSPAAAEAGVGIGTVGGEERVTWGSVFFDYDADGDEDLYVVSGFGEQRNVLLRNEGGTGFTDASATSGADDPTPGRGVAYLDFNGDGCLDLFVGNYGQRATLLKNTCRMGNNWLIVSPRGTVSNRDGIGARITVHAGGAQQIREVSAGSSQMGQSMLSAHFGLGQAAVAESVTVRWPSGKVQTLIEVPANQRLTVIEP